MTHTTPPSEIPLLSEDDLLDYFRQGEKPPSQWRIGSEHELFVLDASTFERLPYDRIRGLLESIAATGSWEPVFEGSYLIGLAQGSSTISLEPGGQLELSGAPHPHLHAMVEEIEAYHEVLRSLQEQHHCVFVALGLDPFSTPQTVPWMPKERYAFMRSYMPSKGDLGLDMMGCTATIQVNLDYSSEEDMARKLRVALAIQPFLCAFFASSPLRESQNTGWASFRQHIWTQTDPDRCGIPEVLWSPQGGYERYKEYALDVPMYFIKREHYSSVKNLSFRAFMANQDVQELSLNIEDWALHLSTLFPDVRLKHYLELRGADSVPPPLMYGLAAFWVGLLYDELNLKELDQRVRLWTYQDILTLRAQVARQGWHGTVFQDRPLEAWCEEWLQRAHQGLERRGVLKKGHSESMYLAPLFSMVASQETLADALLRDQPLLGFKDLKQEALKPYMI